MNAYQIEFTDYWDKLSNRAFYKAIAIVDHSDFTKKILDKQREELSAYIKKDINETFFDNRLRPTSTVWLENLQKEYPDIAAQFIEKIKACEISSRGYENIMTIAAGGVSALTGAAIGKKNTFAAVLLVLAGIGTAGAKIISSINVDTQALQKEIKKQFEIWKTSLLNILEGCTNFEESEKHNDE